MEIHKPKTIQEAIEDLEIFFLADLYSKFKPKEKIENEVWVREDIFKNRKDFILYIEGHFSILKKEIKELEKKNEKTRTNSNPKPTPQFN